MILILTSFSALAEDVYTKNLRNIKGICLVSPEINVGLSDSDTPFLKNTTTVNDLFQIIKNKSQAYRIPLASSNCTFNNYLSVYIDVTDSINSGVRAVSYKLQMNTYAMPGGYEGVTTWEIGGSSVTSRSTSDLNQYLTNKIGDFMDKFAAHWATSH